MQLTALSCLFRFLWRILLLLTTNMRSLLYALVCPLVIVSHLCSLHHAHQFVCFTMASREEPLTGLTLAPTSPTELRRLPLLKRSTLLLLVPRKPKKLGVRLPSRNAASFCAICLKQSSKIAMTFALPPCATLARPVRMILCSDSPLMFPQQILSILWPWK